jgi:arylsulfatase
MSYDLPWANASNTPFRLFKHWVHEGGISTPILIRWPAIGTSSKVIDTPVHFIDIMPTCVEAAGATYPEAFHGEHPLHPLPGESLVAYMQGQKSRREASLFWEHEGNCAVRRDEWKLVKKFPGDWELYNFEQDRTELHDLRSKNQSLAKQLQRQYHEWAQKLKIVPWERLKDIAPE